MKPSMWTRVLDALTYGDTNDRRIQNQAESAASRGRCPQCGEAGCDGYYLRGVPGLRCSREREPVKVNGGYEATCGDASTKGLTGLPEVPF